MRKATFLGKHHARMPGAAAAAALMPA